MSIEPRSPQTANETSTATSQRASRSEDRHQLHEVRVSLVEQSIKLLAVPAEAQINRRPECRGGPFELTKLDVVDPAPIDPRDQRSRELGDPTDVLLAQILPQAKRSELAPEPDPIHRAELGRRRLPTAQRAIIQQLHAD